MGLLDNIRSFFSGSKNSQAEQVQDNSVFEKSRLANSIVDLVKRIQKINSFDSSIWNLANISSYDLQKKSLDELQRINSSLESRLSELSRQNQSKPSERESLESSKWTGQKPKGMSDYDFDRFQRDDDR